MRAFLTMLGIIIGVAAVIIITGLGNGMQNYMTEQFEGMGTRTLNINLTGRGSNRTVSVDRMYEIAEENNELVAYISPKVNVSGAVRCNNENLSSSVTGVGEDYLSVNAWTLASGRFLQYFDISARKKVCAVGSYYQSADVFDGAALGKTLKINGELYNIVGVIEEIADSTENSTDNMVLIPYSNATKFSRNATISSYVAAATSDDTVIEAQEKIEEALYEVFLNDDLYTVFSMTEILGIVNEIMDIVVGILAGIAGISLAVGGIGIMNIMLVSVTERTREIGIRKALGAKQRDIKSQFIIEAGTTSAIGGILGIIVGISIAGVIGPMFDITAVPKVDSVMLAFGISVGIGIIFGFLPANKAAKLNPIDALRHD
ncbi:MAG: FtsX-like permease family protein [Ruminococcaceae bacterium]|nr:FtsX-like permease family protein [Oscillospiraceae bacterium]